MAPRAQDAHPRFSSHKSRMGHSRGVSCSALEHGTVVLLWMCSLHSWSKTAHPSASAAPPVARRSCGKRQEQPASPDRQPTTAFPTNSCFQSKPSRAQVARACPVPAVLHGDQPGRQLTRADLAWAFAGGKQESYPTP